MAQTSEIRQKLAQGEYDGLLQDIYVDKNLIIVQRKRYDDALAVYEKLYGTGDVSIFSAPGRSEVGGNHTDHQHGEILAASINLDAIAIGTKREDGLIKVTSDGYDEIVVDIRDLDRKEEEKETTASLIKGVCAGVKEHGFKIGGFQVYITSDVLIGAGLSSSAAFETLVGTVLSYMYNDGKIDPVLIAIIGQYAENVYFGKPCGLMDQMACSVGNLVHVDFAVSGKPVVEKVDFDMNAQGYSLCITDTKGSHADLTADYAAVPKEMKQVASYFGQEVLLGLTIEDLCQNMTALREKFGDRAVLRAIHFIQENERVRKETEALKQGDLTAFFAAVRQSGDSSYKYLQNVYSNSDITHQNVALALALSEIALGDAGVCRVHGGGFAGTIQAFVKNTEVEKYVAAMERIFGEGSCHNLKIRKYGGMKVLE